MITKWLCLKYINLDTTDDDLQDIIFTICAMTTIMIAILLDMFLIVPEFIYGLLKTLLITLLIILKGNKNE